MALSFSLAVPFPPFLVSMIAFCLAIAGVLVRYDFSAQLKFIWYCFLRPCTSDNQKATLEKFYKGQAHVYDSTRSFLLRGRSTMLSLSAAHLKVLREVSPDKRLVWVDIGGGTGYNIELMDKYFPVSSFDAIYLIDLCDSLLDVARRRFAEKGWKNIIVLCQDASEFTLPEWSTMGTDAKGSVGFVTLSYSLSMIPTYYAVLDRIDYVLSPNDGLLGIVDFYTSGRQSSLQDKAIGGLHKECGWLSRWFWQIWFDFDHVYLGPARRTYLEYKFGTVKSFNGRNRFFLPFIVQIPYYIWLGRPGKHRVGSFNHTLGKDIEGRATTYSELVQFTQHVTPTIGAGINNTVNRCTFYYQVQKPWRLPYYEQSVHKEFRTFIYSFTWEDPFQDTECLDLSSDDTMLVITSAGDNALHYAISARPKEIHCVDMNPCQGHLLELKLAAFRRLTYAEFFSMFGDGRRQDFHEILDSKLSPYLSSEAYQFWRMNCDLFSTSFYTCGYSGIALRLARLVFSVCGISKDVEALCNCSTLEEQISIWCHKIKPTLLNPVIISLLQSPMFCWNALGVPTAQRGMILEEGTFYDYILHTFEPVVSKYLLKNNCYFYLLTLLGHYTRDSCPLYLTAAGFESLNGQNGKALDIFKLHTDSIINVLHGLKEGSLTKVVIMDHLDWFLPGGGQAEEEIAELCRAVAPGGYVLWRSASKIPWYNDIFRKTGFEVVEIAVREGSTAIDRVNMYRSCWRAARL